MGLFIQVLSPYTDEDPDVVLDRVLKTEIFMNELLKQGHCPTSVVTAFHYMAHNLDLPTDFEFWKDYCYTVMDRADIIYVLRLDGWDKSVGVLDEIARALRIGKTVMYFDAV